MSRDSQVTSLPEAGWSCATLVGGVEAAASLAGLKLNPKDVDQAGPYIVMSGQTDTNLSSISQPPRGFPRPM